MPVVDDSGRPVGIFTQHDVIGRIVLPQVPLSAPIAQVMSVPARTLPVHASAGDAVTLMVRHGVRHVLVVDDGRLVGVVSERDLFALQRLTSRQVGTAIRRAADVAELRQAAADIRALAKTLVVQGVGAGQLTRLLSDLNDQLTSRLLDLVSVSHDLSGVEACWMALGSEGRHEQTIATDQDNGLIFATQDDVERARARALAFAREVNEALAACGFPLCKGGVMASNPRWCATPAEWRATFAGWIDRGDPESLLGANVFFDFRPLWGAAGLADALREWVAEHARSNRRFLKQMADNALRNRAPLTVLGGIRAAGERNGEPAIDLKLNGSVPIVDAARIYALASGVTATSTSERLQRAGAELAIPAVEVRALVDAFDYIQLMRLRTQLAAAPDDPNPNLVALSAIGEIDARVLKEAFRHARRAQSRLEMDYPG
jgi:CBS domain-containing protein